MSEIQRSEVRDEHAAADRDGKIEQLLLVGLDHYFSERYEQAINVWTRALFLDRSHPRARAYIDRARSALAERQRQSEELLHDGVAAFHRGEGDEARRLLQAAIDGGAPSEEALAVLGRLDRLEVPASSNDTEVDSAPARRGSGRTRRDGKIGSNPSALSFVLASVALFGILAWGGYAISASGVDWRGVLSYREPAGQGVGAPVTDLSLPLPRRAEIAVANARALAASGRLHEAIAALETVRATDPQKAEADRLRGDLQRQLLALTPLPPIPPEPPARRLP